MEQTTGDEYMSILSEKVALIEERKNKLETSPKNSEAELVEKRAEVERITKLLDESVGNPGLHDSKTRIDREIENAENKILEEINPGYVQEYNDKMMFLDSRLLQASKK